MLLASLPFVQGWGHGHGAWGSEMSVHEAGEQRKQRSLTRTASRAPGQRLGHQDGVSGSRMASRAPGRCLGHQEGISGELPGPAPGSDLLPGAQGMDRRGDRCCLSSCCPPPTADTSSPARPWPLCLPQKRPRPLCPCAHSPSSNVLPLAPVDSEGRLLSGSLLAMGSFKRPVKAAGERKAYTGL